MNGEQRLRILERRCRYLQVTCGSLSLMVAAVALSAYAQTPPPRVIESQAFVLTDSAGKPRGQWGTFGDGTFLTLSAAGKPRLALDVDADGLSTIEISSPTGVSLRLSGHREGATVTFLDATGQKVGGFGVDASGKYLGQMK